MNHSMKMQSNWSFRAIGEAATMVFVAVFKQDNMFVIDKEAGTVEWFDAATKKAWSESIQLRASTKKVLLEFLEKDLKSLTPKTLGPNPEMTAKMMQMVQENQERAAAKKRIYQIFADNYNLDKNLLVAVNKLVQYFTDHRPAGKGSQYAWWKVFGGLSNIFYSDDTNYLPMPEYFMTQVEMPHDDGTPNEERSKIKREVYKIVKECACQCVHTWSIQENPSQYTFRSLVSELVKLELEKRGMGIGSAGSGDSSIDALDPDSTIDESTLASIFG